MNEDILSGLEDFIDGYCLDDCPNNDGEVCESCHVRKLMDKARALMGRED